MFTGYLLSEGSKELLMELFPPLYPDVIAHHITETFGIKDAPVPDKPESVNVVGHIDNGESVQGLLVEIDGSTTRKAGSKYHITWSLDRKIAKSVDTKKYTDSATMLNQKIAIEVIPKYFKY